MLEERKFTREELAQALGDEIEDERVKNTIVGSDKVAGDAINSIWANVASMTPQEMTQGLTRVVSQIAEDHTITPEQARRALADTLVSFTDDQLNAEQRVVIANILSGLVLTAAAEK